MKKNNRPVNLNKGKNDVSENDFSFLIDELIRFIPFCISIVVMVCCCIYVSELYHIYTNESKIAAITETADNAVSDESKKEDNDDLLWFVLFNYYYSLSENY